MASDTLFRPAGSLIVRMWCTDIDADKTLIHIKYFLKVGLRKELAMSSKRQ